MGELEWLECVRVSPSILRAPDVLGRLDAYSEQISAQLKMLNGEQSEKKEYNVWYDKIDGVYFSGCQFNELRMFGKDQHFYTTKKRFIQHSKDQYLKNFSNIESPFLNTRFLVDKNLDFLYSNPELFDQYSGSTIMIVGGGPSTQDVAWENIRADYIWTCNEFYKNKKFNNKKVDLVSLAPLVDEHLMDSPLESCFESNEDLIAAFPIDRSGMSTAPLQEFFKKYPAATKKEDIGGGMLNTSLDAMNTTLDSLKNRSREEGDWKNLIFNPNMRTIVETAFDSGLVQEAVNEMKGPFSLVSPKAGLIKSTASLA